jgi:hypothetical protein
MDLFPVYVDGMDYNSATEILGLSRGTLASRLLQGRAQLRALWTGLKERNDEPGTRRDARETLSAALAPRHPARTRTGAH